MKRTIAFLATVIAVVAWSGGAYAMKCSGAWDGSVPTSVTFQGGDNIRYCYKTECWNSEIIGDKSKKFMFRVGNSGATVEMVARSGGYRATWRYGNNSSKANLQCK